MSELVEGIPGVLDGRPRMRAETVHDRMVRRAARWATTDFACSFALIECAGKTDRPDVLAWRDGRSVQIECKSSRGDFLAQVRQERRVGWNCGVGQVRMFMMLANTIGTEELPLGWGLAIWNPDTDRVALTVGPRAFKLDPAIAERDADLLARALTRVLGSKSVEWAVIGEGVNRGL